MTFFSFVFNARLCIIRRQVAYLHVKHLNKYYGYQRVHNVCYFHLVENRFMHTTKYRLLCTVSFKNEMFHLNDVGVK